MRRDIPKDAVPMLCASCEGRNKGICSALNCDQLAELAKTSRKFAAGSGAALLGEAERIDRYANILSGVVKLTKTLSDGR